MKWASIHFQTHDIVERYSQRSQFLRNTTHCRKQIANDIERSSWPRIEISLGKEGKEVFI